MFCAVAEAESFTGAAKALRLPKSTVSRRVALLESELGTRLLQRTTRQLALTDAGRLLFDHGRRAVLQAQEAEDALRHLQSVPRGRLRVTAPLTMAVLGGVVARFLRIYPEVQVELVCTDRVVDLVHEGFDVALRAGRLDDSSLVQRSLGAVERRLVASPAYLASRPAPRHPKALARHDAVLVASGRSPGVWAFERGRTRAEVTPLPRLIVNDFAPLLEAVLAGLGLAVLPVDVTREHLAAGRLVHVLPTWAPPRMPFQVVMPSHRHVSPALRAFLDVVSEHYLGR